MNIKYKIISQEELSKEFVYSLLKMGLYEQSYENSRLKHLYKQVISEDKRFDAILAYSDNKPIGIAVLEPLAIQHQACILTNGFSYKSKPKMILDKIFNVYGFLQLYVVKEFRNNGIAKEMTKQIELFKLSNMDIKDNELPMLVAKDGAYEIAEKYLQFSYLIRSNKNYTNIPIDIHWQTYEYIQKAIEKKKDSFVNENHMNYIATNIQDYVKQNKFKI